MGDLSLLTRNTYLGIVSLACCLDDTLTAIPLSKPMPLSPPPILMTTHIWEMREEEVVEGGRDLKVNQSPLDYGASCASWELPLPRNPSKNAFPALSVGGRGSEFIHGI